MPRNADSNPDGGRFGVAEGDIIVGPVCSLIAAASACGALIAASRDYHPHDHASFSTEGGPFPPHCVQGTPGADFLPQVALALSAAKQRDPRRVCVAFKAFHEDVDSFGGFPYARGGPGRLTRRAPGWAAKSCPMGCTACPWTGCIVLKQSGLEVAAARDEAPDMNAPPDLLAMTEEEGRGRGRRPLQDVLRPARRLFVCGLALDFCVLDTCLNALDAGFSSVHLVLDAVRALHIT